MPKEKLRIRLPTDTDANPYDSKTQLKDLHHNRWLWDWKWWAMIVAIAGGWALVSFWRGTF